MKPTTKALPRDRYEAEEEIDFSALADLREALSPHWAARIYHKTENPRSSRED